MVVFDSVGFQPNHYSLVCYGYQLRRKTAPLLMLHIIIIIINVLLLLLLLFTKYGYSRRRMISTRRQLATIMCIILVYLLLKQKSLFVESEYKELDVFHVITLSI